MPRSTASRASAERPSATLELSAKLIHSLDQRVVASRTFLVAEPAAGTDLGSVTAAFETALGRTTTELIGWTLASGQADWQAHPVP